MKVCAINMLMATLAHITNDDVFKLTYRTVARLAENVAQKDYYVGWIRRIRELFDEGHPCLEITKKLLRYPNPHHRRTIIQTFIINQLLVGTNKRKSFAQTPGGFYPPGFLVISPTMRCNLRCFGCYAGSYKRNSELSVETIDRVLNEAKEMGMYFITVSGGEPFYWEHIFDMFQKHNDMFFLVYTHGGLIDEKVAEKIVSAGNVLPSISIEGFREFTDRRRGAGHFDRVMRAMDMLREAGVIFGYSSTQTRENHDTVTSDEFVDFMADKGCLLGCYFMYVPVGREPNIDLMPTPAQRDHLRACLGRWRNSKDILFIDFWNDGPVVGGCISGGRKYAHINANGDVEPCVFCHFATHNIHSSSLREALNSPLFQAIKAQQPFDDNLLCPCMLVDHPLVGRDIALKHGAYFTHDGAEIIFTQLADAIDEFADSYKSYADLAWQTHYQPARGEGEEK
ncbi:MAG: radical SAM protein [Desulfobacterales bacterium]|nr:radical SAM protein [Desulfobacterales bacterium]